MGGSYIPRNGSVTVGTIAKTIADNHGLSERAVTAILTEGFDQVASAVYDGKRVMVRGLGVFRRRNFRPVNTGAITCDATSRAYYSPAKWLRGLPPVQPSGMDEGPP